MAERRRLTDLVHGHVGKVTYIPREDESRQPGVLHTGRITSSAPYLKVIGSSAELYPASKTKIPEGSSSLWQERRTQKRWLLKSHPEAFMGNSALQGLMEENIERFHRVEGQESDRPLLAIGQMTDVRIPSRVSGAMMMAVATGESGELLRLARIEESNWRWGQHKDVGLKLSVIDPDDQEDEVVWGSDGLPISQIKFATSLSRYESTRWLIVQKQTSTAILQPEYHKVPVAQKHSIDFSVQQRLSRIDPHPILTISHKETGGNAHTDVSFNPGCRGQPPQIVIVDECGYWTVWNILGTNKVGQSTIRSSLDKCGHMWEGTLEDVPPSTEFAAEKHGVLFVGTAEVDSFWDDPSQDSEESGVSTKRSQHILLWNRTRFEVIDLSSGTALPKLPSFTTTSMRKTKPDWILDVQRSPIDQNHVFVLTKWNLYWIDLFKSRGDEETPPRPVVLLTCPHLIDVEGMRMTTCLTSSEKSHQFMLFIFSSQYHRVQAYWFGQSTEKGLPHWHRQILTFPHDGKGSDSSIHSIEMRPAKLLSLGAQASGPGSQYQRSGVQFFQGNFLGKDLSVRYCICASYRDPDLEIMLPSLRMGYTNRDQAQRWKRKRKQFIRHMGTTFVLPEGMTEADIESAIRPNSRNKQSLASQSRQMSPNSGAMSLKFDRFCNAIRGSLTHMSGEVNYEISPALLSAIQDTIENGSIQGRLPLTTWQEIAREYESSANTEPSSHAGQLDILDLFDKADEDTIVTHLGKVSPHESASSLISLAQLNQYFSRLWLEPLEGKLSAEEQQIRRSWIAELAQDAFLSSYGVMVQDTRLLGLGNTGGVEESQASNHNSIPIKSSQSATPSIASSPPASASTAAPDAAIQRLQLLAPSLHGDKMSDAKQSSVLSHWPTELGVSTQDYVSSVAVATDRKFDVARDRLKKIEARRKAQAEKYKLPAFMRQGVSQGESSRANAEELPTQPVPMQIMSSQAVIHSSQSQGFGGPSVAMSQPVPGAFGDRKKVKKGKRKSGFR